MIAAGHGHNLHRSVIVGGGIGGLMTAKAEATAGARFLERLRADPDLDWTFLSPSADFAPGERTGHFRLGGDQLLRDAQGESHISMEDFAIAMVDEVEKHAHSRQRFTVGY
jgi:putative NADH-flavin reductase